MALSILTLGSHSQGVGLSLGPITVGRARTVSYMLDFIFVYVKFHLLFYHLVAGNLPSLWKLIICFYPSVLPFNKCEELPSYPTTAWFL